MVVSKLGQESLLQVVLGQQYGLWAPIWSGLLMARSTSWNITESMVYRISLLTQLGVRTQDSMLNGIALQHPSHISQIKTQIGQINFISGEWTGMKRL